MERDYIEIEIDIDSRLLDYWLASIGTDQDEPEPQCECGGDKTNTGHSVWCPKFGKS